MTDVAPGAGLASVRTGIALLVPGCPAGPVLVSMLAGLVAGCELLDPSAPDTLVPGTVDEDDTLPFIDLNGSRFHVRTFGDPDDPVIVFLHGGPGSSLFGLLPYHEVYDGHGLAEDHFLVFWDQRGAGLSRRHDPSDVTWDLYLEDLHALVEHYSPEAKVDLVAFSFGGTYAAAYVDRYPEDVDGLVLISPAPLSGALYAKADFIGSGLWEGTADVLWSHQIFAQDDHARMDYLLAASMLDALHPGFHIDPARIPEYRRFGAVCQSALYAELRLIPPNDPPVFNFTGGLRRLPRPVLGFAGADDELFTEAFEREQLGYFAEHELVVVPGYGHDVAFAYAEVQPRIVEYLEGS
ncbi:alpha/beta fold hydrolase [Paraliomyxa miuraensis]|uniref:alpha/beta fold hydrolase n=1 Tax=Paraliomyxa miuraensis TaxID=376150 RepID=UPI00224F6F64|nr:alpha/beta hydrolase [Paraliomyxa miuraensis]MCX4243073.1 alpha/beta hydrolase [Paraliomyxa miuraensis]